jgi:hypothetical protein
MRNVLRAAAAALDHLTEKVDSWLAAMAARATEYEFAGVDFVGIDFSTSIQEVAGHVITGWDRYRRQVRALRPDRGVWAFGVNCLPFPLTRRPVPPDRLPDLRAEHFRRRGDGRGLVEYGSAFYDYFAVALEHAWELAEDEGCPADPVPATVALLCDGMPNGGTYRADDVRPQVEQARAWGMRFRVVGFVRRKYRAEMERFRDSLGLTDEDLEIAWYDTGVPDEESIHHSFLSLSRF